MIRKKLLKKLAISVVCLAVITEMAVFFHLPDLLWWFDMPMHLLGGFTVFCFSAIVWLPARTWVPDPRYLYEAIITTILIGVLWEALELYLYLHYGTPNFILLDSFSDVFFDLAGAALAAFFIVPLLTAEKAKLKA